MTRAELGEAITHVDNYEKINLAKSLLSTSIASGKDKGALPRLRADVQKITDTAALAKANGLYQDPKFLEHLILLTKYGFSDQLELHQELGEALYTSCLKRDCLRESDELIIRKYSRKTERKLIVLGLITQGFGSASTQPPNVEKNPENMKAAITALVNHIGFIESSLSGKLAREVVVDPIAVYAEI